MLLSLAKTLSDVGLVLILLFYILHTLNYLISFVQIVCGCEKVFIGY